MKSRYMQGLGWEIRADVREHNTPNMPMDPLVQYARRKGDVCRRRLQEQRIKRTDGPRPVGCVALLDQRRGNA